MLLRMRMTFLEVDAEDAIVVSGRFPQASVIDGILSGPELIEACKGSEIISCFIHTRFPKEVIGKLPKLRLLSTRSVGYATTSISLHARSVGSRSATSRTTART